jgi:threonine/homoserine/homoserine lactone efflux protein
MTAHAFLLFVGASSMIAIAPGPNVLLVVSRAATYGARGTIPVGLGIAVAASIYLVATVLGLTVVVAAFPTALTVLRVLGACYLAYVGLRMIMASASKRLAEAGAPQQLRKTSLLAQGFWTCFSNPKCLLYWSAFLPQFIDPNDGIARQLILLGLTGILLEVIVLGTYAGLASAASRMMDGSRARRSLQLLAGAVLVALGASLGLNSLGAHRLA